MKVKLTEPTRALANATSSDDDRPILTGVRVTKTDAVAADGNLIVIKCIQNNEMQLDEQPDDGINEVIIPASALKACKGETTILQTVESLKTKAVSELLDAKATTTETKIVARMEGEDYNVEADSIEGKYPEYQALLNGLSPLVGQIAFSTNILKKLIKTLPNDSHIQLRISEPDKPVEFQCTDPDGDLPIRGIVMPLNISWQYTKWKTRESPE